MINSNFWGSPKKFTLFVVDFDLGNQIEPILWCIFKLHTQTLRNTYTYLQLWMNGITIVPLSTIIYFTTFRKQTFWEENKKLVFKGSNFAKHGALMALKVAIRVQK